LHVAFSRTSALAEALYSPEAFLEEENRLNTELVDIQDAEQESDASMHEVIKEVVLLSELLKNAHIYYSSANSEEKEQIMRIIFSELTLSGDTLQYKCKNGFAALESRFVVSHEPNRDATRKYVAS